MRIEVSDASATVFTNQSGTLLVMRHGVAIAREQASTNASILLGFLEPDRGYQLFFQTSDGTVTLDFRTRPSEWSLSDSEEATRPGSNLIQGNSNCSAGFILRDATNSSLYVLTAGHCFPMGTSVYDAQHRTIGTVVVSHSERQYDFALIKVDPAYRANVRADMVAWGGPSKPTDSGTVRENNPACHHGFGGGLHGSSDRARCGRFWSARSDNVSGRTIVVFEGQFSIWQGDSGSGVIDGVTGYPIGIITQGLHQYSAQGPTLCSILERLHADDGYRLRPLFASRTSRAPDAPAPLPPRSTGEGQLATNCW